MLVDNTTDTASNTAETFADSESSFQVPQHETLPKDLEGADGVHCSPVEMPELRMPAPVSATFSQSSSSLANSLITPPASPPAHHSSVTIPTIPRVPVLNLPPRPTLHHDRTFLGIPRSPSAPTFMQQQMQPMLFGGAAPEATASSTTTTDLRVARGPGMRRVSCPPKPQFDLFGQEVPKATEAALPVADALMSAPSPLSVAASDNTGIDYFPEFIQRDDNKGADEYLSFIAQDLAGPAALASWQADSEFMVCAFSRISLTNPPAEE